VQVVTSAWGINLLGVPSVRRHDQAPEPLERKASALLAYVAIEGPTSRATLAGLLWPNVVDARARNNLRQLLHRLRAYEGLLDAGTDVRLGAIEADVSQLSHLHERGDAATIADGWSAEAPELLRGHAFDDCPDFAEWLAAERARIMGTVTRAVEAEAERHEAAGNVRRALDHAQRLIALDALSERAYRRVMRLHYLSGDRGQALETYRRCKEMLSTTFGVEPLPDTLELARAIDAGSVEVLPRPEARELPVALMRPPRLVGREAAWSRLEAAWQRVRTIVVVGEAGIGKTRLVHDFVRSKGPFLASKGMPGEKNVPYAAIARRFGDLLRAEPEIATEDWVRSELARLLPDMFQVPAGLAPIGDEPQKLRLFEAMATVLRRALEDKVALVNDDLHLWDEASFDVGTYFISRFADSHAHSVGTLRAEEMNRDRLREVERAVEAGMAEIIELQPLDVEQLGQLVSEVVGDAAAPPATEVLKLSGGNPFYALEFLRSRWGAEDWTRTPASASSSSDDASGVLDQRLRRLSGAAQDLLRVRAFSGTSFTTELAVAVLETSRSEVEAALSELQRQRLVGADLEGHELVYEAVTRRTPPEARRLWHQRVAVHMAAFGARPAAIATQYLAAWQPATAFPFLLRAGADARAVYALDEARRWFLKALWAASDDRQRAEALLAVDDVAGQRGPGDEASAVLDELERLAGALQEPTLLIESALRRARLLTLRGDHATASRLATEAYDEAARLGDPERAERARLTLGDLAYFAGRFDEAQQHFLDATASASDTGRLRAFQRLGALEGMRGDLDAAVGHHRQALTLARKRNDLPLVATLLNSVGADRERLGQYDEATRDFRRAADVAIRVGDRRTAAIARANASLTFVNRGDLAAALLAAEAALEAARPLGIDRAVAMAHFVHGYALRRLGRSAAARNALAQAVRLREAARDIRGALVAKFNLVAMALELPAGLAAPATDAAAPSQTQGNPPGEGPAEDAEAILAELEGLDIPQFCAWCHVELAFLSQEPDTARAHLERAVELERGPHFTFAAQAAHLRADLLAGDAAAIKTARTRLADGTNGAVYLESSLAQLLLACSSRSGSERDEHLAEAHGRIRAEVGALGEEAARARLAYLEQRVPEVG